jgi:hypothetical protein
MKISKYQSLLAVLLGLGLQASTRAGDFYFPIGVGFSSGHIDVFNKIEDSYRAAGFHLHNDVLVPVGLSFNPYYEFDFGLGIGPTLGPTAFYNVHLDTPPGPYRSPDDNNRFSYIIPVGANLRYTFLRHCDVSPYIIGGVRYPIAGGDDLSSNSQPGPYAGIGVEFLRTQRICYGVEFGYDGSRVKVKDMIGGGSSRVTFSGFTGSLFVIF